MYLYIGIAIAGGLLLLFTIICIVKCCCTCYQSDESNNKKSGKLGNTKRLSVKVRRTTSWIKTRSLPKAPCDEETCVHSECPSITSDDDGHKLLKSPKKKTNINGGNKTAEGVPLSPKRNVYEPSPRAKRTSREIIVTPPLPSKTAFNFQPTTGEEDTYYSQPNLNSTLSTSAASGHTAIELFDLGTKNTSNNVEIVDDDDFDEFGSPDAEDFRGKERSYSKLSYTASDTSHYQGLNPNTLSKQNSKHDVNRSGPNSDAPSPVTPLPTLRQNTMSLSDSETKSVLYQSLDSPPYQSIEQYQEAYGDDRSSNEYLEPQDGGSYQDMNLAAYSSPRPISSYPFTKQYLSDKQTSFSSDTDLQQYVLPNNEKSDKKDSDVNDSPAAKHYEISDVDTDYQSDYHATSYLDLTAPDEEIDRII